MRFSLLVLIALALALALTPARARASDKALAASLGAAAAKLASDGKVDKAKEVCYKALANDEDAAEALYELGKIFEKDGQSVTAGDFLVRAARQFAKEEAGTPAFAGKRMDAERRAKLLNPFATRFTDAMTEYAAALGAIAKKTPDSLTAEEALDRVSLLQLANILPPEKLPAIDKPKPTETTTTKRIVDEEGFIRTVKKEIVTNVPPEVERALKTAGWSTITGTWKKKADNVYEVTNGKLETPKLNGAIQCTVHKGDAGKVRMMVRDKQQDSRYYYSGSYSSTGYGFLVEGAAAKMYSASGGYFYSSSSGIYRPYYERDVPLPLPKNRALIQINEGNLQMFVNGKREHNSNYKLGKDGPFVIEVDGTWTLEDPRAIGQ